MVATQTNENSNNKRWQQKQQQSTGSHKRHHNQLASQKTAQQPVPIEAVTAIWAIAQSVVTMTANQNSIISKRKQSSGGD